MIELSDKDIQIFINVMKEQSCYDFSNYSVTSLKRRIFKILITNNLKIEDLAEKIRGDHAFGERIAKSITVCTTELFRDPEVWRSLRTQMLPGCCGREGLKIWHAGCSTGQEVYSMMMILNEMELLEKSEILATDLNQDALDVAAAGKYNYNFNINYIDNFNKVFNESFENHNPGNKIPFNKYFTADPETDIIQMKPFLTKKPVYKKFDLVKDGKPFNSIFDAIICRNVIIYFNVELQNKVIDLFYRSLSDNGCVILGTHESIDGPFTNVFEKKSHGYFKRII
jgi:chemotaxis protein methyltransferase CheR